MLTDYSAEQFRALRCNRSNQQAPITPAPDRQLLRAGIFVFDQPFSRCNEIVENVLLVFQQTCFVPGFTKLASAANVGYSIDPSLLCPPHFSRVEIRRQTGIEPAVAV